MKHLNENDLKALQEAGLTEILECQRHQGHRLIKGVATDEVTEVQGVWHDGESAQDIVFEYI